MGISTEEFIKKMYGKASTGDWSEFGDKATQLKWVDFIVDDIRETAQVKHPDLSPKPTPTFTMLPLRGAEASAAGTPEVLKEKKAEEGKADDKKK